MKQPLLAAPIAGGSLLAGVAAMLVGGYEVADCMQFRTGPGQCNGVVQRNAPALVAGMAAIAGTVAGLFTYNRLLERDEPKAVLETGKELVRDAVLETGKRTVRNLVLDTVRDNAGLDVWPGPVVSPVAAAPAPESRPEPLSFEEQVAQLHAEGTSQQAIADQLKTTVYQVRKALGK